MTPRGRRSAARNAIASLYGLTGMLAATSAFAAERWVDEPVPAGIRVEVTDLDGPIFADARGRTLYYWGDDQPGKSLCNDDHYAAVAGSGQVNYTLPESDKRLTCEAVWPPLAASADAKPVGKWSVITRHDGSKQWAYRNRPIYTSVNDQRPGEVNGGGFR